jgi:DNA-binding MarR family transcriptional regulator
MDEKEQRLPKDLRYRTQYFPEAHNLVFHTKDKGFVPLPIILRKLMKTLTAPELRVLIYLYLRSSKYSICYPTIAEMVAEIGLSGAKNLMPHLKSLEAKKFISMSNSTSTGRRFFLVHSPRVAILEMLRRGEMSKDELFEINELLENLNQEPIVFPAQNGVEAVQASSSSEVPEERKEATAAPN